MKRVCIFIIKLYQKYISPIKGKSTCRFYPTCSHYAIEAFDTHGFFIGTGLTVWRILRCNPFCAGGIDKVPQKISFKKKKTTDKDLRMENPNDNSGNI